MPRHSRLDFHGAIHYVQIQGRDGLQIFFHADTIVSATQLPTGFNAALKYFMSLIAEVSDECNMTIHGYCVEPNICTLVLQRHGAPLEAFMRRLGGQYAKHVRALNRMYPKQIFRARYRSMVVAPEYLPHVIRRAQRRLHSHEQPPTQTDFPYSSHAAHLGERSETTLNTQSLREALDKKGYRGLHGYREFMAQDDTPYVADLLANGSPLDPRIVGSRVFVQQAHHQAAHPEGLITKAELISSVAHLLHASPADIYGATHRGALGRSLVAWFGLRCGAATLTEIGRWFNVTGATLGQSLSHHRKSFPNMFTKRHPANLAPRDAKHFLF